MPQSTETFVTATETVASSAPQDKRPIHWDVRPMIGGGSSDISGGGSGC